MYVLIGSIDYLGHILLDTKVDLFLIDIGLEYQDVENRFFIQRSNRQIPIARANRQPNTDTFLKYSPDLIILPPEMMVDYFLHNLYHNIFGLFL